MARSVPSRENRVKKPVRRVRIKAPSGTCQTATTPSHVAESSVSFAEKLMPWNGPKRFGPDNSRRSVQFEVFHSLMELLMLSKKAPEASKVPSCEQARPV